MQGPSRSGKLLLAAAAILFIMHASLIISSRLLPFTDLPNHLAAATIVRYAGDPDNSLGEYFETDLFPRPNVLHAYFCSLPLFPSVESANRAFYVLYLLLLPLSVAVLIGVLGGDIRLAAGSFLLAYSYGVSWGFAGFTMSVPFTIFSAAASVRYARRGGAAPWAVSATLLAALFFIHLQSLLFALILHAAALAAQKGIPARRRLAGAACALPAAALISAWWIFGRNWWLGEPTVPFLADYYRARWIKGLPSRWKIVFIDNYHLFDGAAGIAAGITVTAAVASAAFLSGSGSGAGRSGGSRTAGALLAAAAACCLMIPRDLPGQSIVYQRFPVFLALFALVYGASRAGARGMGKSRRAGAAAALLVAACLAHFMLWADYFIDFNRENRGFDGDFLPDGRKERILAGLILDHTYRGRPIYIHFPGYYTVWKKGVAVTSIVGYRFGPVRRKVDLTVLPEYLEWVGRHDTYDGRYSSLDYILLRGEPSGASRRIYEKFRRRAEEGRWVLLERRSD